MNKQNFIQYLAGSIMGVVLGVGLTFIILEIYNLLCRWRECVLMELSWWDLIPLPLLLGVSMALVIRNLTLSD